MAFNRVAHMAKQKTPKWGYTSTWEATCPKCDIKFNDRNYQCCWCNKSNLAIRTYSKASQHSNSVNGSRHSFWLKKSHKTSWFTQELHCYDSCGFKSTSIPCKGCKQGIPPGYIRGRHRVPRGILVRPPAFVEYHFLDSDLALSFSLFRLVFRLGGLPGRFGSVFATYVWYTFYETNDMNVP